MNTSIHLSKKTNKISNNSKKTYIISKNRNHKKTALSQLRICRPPPPPLQLPSRHNRCAMCWKIKMGVKIFYITSYRVYGRPKGAFWGQSGRIHICPSLFSAHCASFMSKWPLLATVKKLTFYIKIMININLIGYNRFS